MNKDLLQEVSEYTPKKLREIEETFAELKKSSNNKNARLKLIKQIKEFTKIPEVVLFIDKEFNAGVVTVYKKSKIKDIIFSVIQKFSTSQKRISIAKLKGLKTVVEPSNMVERVYIFIGKPILKIFTPQEMVAILLHEFGHVFLSTSAIPDSIMNFLKSLLQIFINLPLFSIIIKICLNSVVLAHIVELYVLYNILVVGFIHGITFTQRIEELNSDNYVLKYGYGDELVGALNKFRFKEKVKPGILNMFKSFIKEIAIMFYNIVNPPRHPSSKKRIENLENQIFNQYKKLYPNYQEIIDLVHSDYKNQEVYTK